MSYLSQEPRLQTLKDKSICTLSLSIGLRMCYGSKIHSDALACTETFESVRVKVCPVVRDYTVRYNESEDDDGSYDDDYDYNGNWGNDDGIDYEEETWYALTDGQYGDYPGPGVDYDFLGF